MPPPPRPTLLPYTTLFRSLDCGLFGITDPAGTVRVAIEFACEDANARTLNVSGAVRNPVPEAKIGKHTSELQSHVNLVCRLLLEKKNKDKIWSSSLNEYTI